MCNYKKSFTFQHGVQERERQTIQGVHNKEVRGVGYNNHASPPEGSVTNLTSSPGHQSHWGCVYQNSHPALRGGAGRKNSHGGGGVGQHGRASEVLSGAVPSRSWYSRDWQRYIWLTCQQQQHTYTHTHCLAGSGVAEFLHYENMSIRLVTYMRKVDAAREKIEADIGVRILPLRSLASSTVGRYLQRRPDTFIILPPLIPLAATVNKGPKKHLIPLHSLQGNDHISSRISHFKNHLQDFICWVLPDKF